MLKTKKALCLLLTLVMVFMLLPSTPETSALRITLYNVTLTMEDGKTGAKLDNAGFELWDADADVKLTGFTTSGAGLFMYTGNGSDTAELVTTAGGILKIEELGYGNYYFKEIDAPANYTLPVGDAAKTYFTLGGAFTATASQNAYGTVNVVNDAPYNGTGTMPTYGPRLPSDSYPKYLLDNNNNPLDRSKHYISSFARDANGVFYYNNCIDLSFSEGHAYANLYDDLNPSVRWVLSRSPAAGAPITALSQIIDWYKAIISLDATDFPYAEFNARYGTNEAKVKAMKDMNNTGVDTAADESGYAEILADILLDVGLTDFNQFVELVVIQMAFSAAVWHFTDGLSINESATDCWYWDGGTTPVPIPPAVVKIYNWYMDAYTLNPTTADTFNNTPESFSFVRTDDGSNPLQHTFKLAASPANSNWNNFIIALSGDASFNASSVEKTATLDAVNNKVTVYLNAPDVPYTLTGNTFKLNIWYGRETDSPDGNPSTVNQDHLIVIKNKSAEIFGSGNASVVVKNYTVPDEPPVIPPTYPSPEPSPSPSPSPSSSPSPLPSETPTESPASRETPTETSPPTPPNPNPPPPTPGPDESPEPVVVYDDDGTPLGQWVWDEETEEWIFEENIPLGQLPPTDDTDKTALHVLIVIAMLMIAVVLLSSRRKHRTSVR